MVAPDSAGGTVGKCPVCGMVGTVPLPVWNARPVVQSEPLSTLPVLESASEEFPRFVPKPIVRSKKRKSSFGSGFGCGCLIFALLGVGFVSLFIPLPRPDIRQDPRDEGVPQAVAEPQKRAPVTPLPKPLPPEVKYKITNTELVQPRVGPTARRVSVQLDGKVSEDQLEAIAHEIKNAESRNFTTTIVFFHLPDPGVFGMAWARASFDFGFDGPGLQVHHIGLSKVDEAKILATPLAADADVIGRWSDSTNVYIIFRSHGKFTLEVGVPGGGKYAVNVVEKKTPLGRRFQDPDEPFDHYIIDSKGDLQVRDESGLIEMARKR